MTEIDHAKQMEKMAQGKAAERILEFMGEFVVAELGRIEARVFKLIEAEEYLDPNIAVQAWIQYHAVEQLPKKLRRQMKDGQQAAKKLAEAKAL